MSDEPRQHERKLIDQAWHQAREQAPDATIPVGSEYADTETAKARSKGPAMPPNVINHSAG